MFGCICRRRKPVSTHTSSDLTADAQSNREPLVSDEHRAEAHREVRAEEGFNLSNSIAHALNWISKKSDDILSTDMAYHGLRRAHALITGIKDASTAGFGFAQSYLNSGVILFERTSPAMLQDMGKHIITLFTGISTGMFFNNSLAEVYNPSPPLIAETISTAPSHEATRQASLEMSQIYDVKDLIRLTKDRHNWLGWVGMLLKIKQTAELLFPVFDATFAASTLADWVAATSKSDDNKNEIHTKSYLTFVTVGFVALALRYLLVKSMRLRYGQVPDEQLKAYKGLKLNEVRKVRLIVPSIIGALSGFTTGIYWAMFAIPKMYGSEANVGTQEFKFLTFYTGALSGMGYAIGSVLSDLTYQLLIDPILSDYRGLFQQLNDKQPNLVRTLIQPPSEGDNKLASHDYWPNTWKIWKQIGWGALSSIFHAMTINNLCRALLFEKADSTPSDNDIKILSGAIIGALVLNAYNHYLIAIRDRHAQTYRDEIKTIMGILKRINAAPEEEKQYVIKNIIKERNALPARPREIRSLYPDQSVVNPLAQVAEVSEPILPIAFLTGAVAPRGELVARADSASVNYAPAQQAADGMGEPPAAETGIAVAGEAQELMNGVPAEADILVDAGSAPAGP